MNTTSFPPAHALHDYTLLADGERGALTGPDGTLDWLCAPTWHDDAVFASLTAAAASTPSPRSPATSPAATTKTAP